MDPLEEVRLKIAKVEAEIDALTTEIREADENIRHAGDATEKQRWVKEKEQLRDKETELLKQKNKLLDKEARLESAEAAGPSITETGASQHGQQLQLPEELLAFLRRAIQKETSLDFVDEISVGGSKMDLSDAREALVRMGFERLETTIGVADDACIADADSRARFEWKDAREDDTSNMIRAEEFVGAALAAHLGGFTVVDICQRLIYSRSDATPTKRMKLRDTKTDLAVVMTEFAELAKLNPRNYLAQIAGIVDTKTEKAWRQCHDDFRGQALGQFVGCTLLSGRSGVGFPVLLTNLVGDSHVFHGVQEEGGGFVQEVVFSDQAAAFQYFGKVCSQAEVVQRKKVTDLLAALDNRPPRLPAPPSLSPLGIPLDFPQSHGPVDSDLRECIYREVRREQPLFNLPPFEVMMEYLSNLEQGVARAAEIRSHPSYII